jgi:hypothetical protein
VKYNFNFRFKKASPKLFRVETLENYKMRFTIDNAGIATAKILNRANGVTDNDYNAYVENTYLKTNAQANYTARLIVTGNGCADTAYQYLSIPAK